MIQAPPRPLAGVLLGALLLLAPGAHAAAPDLAERLLAQVSQPRFEAARWGVQVVSLATGRTLFEHNARQFFVPASTLKLFTSALALDALGPGYRIRTSLYGPGQPVAGVLRGDLVLYGRGDPSLLQRWRGGPTVPDALEELAAQVAAAGVRTVAGDLVGDDSFFATAPYGSGWEAGDLDRPFGAEVSALSIHDNTVDLRIYPGPAAGAPCFLFPMPGLGLLPLDNRTRTAADGPALQAHRELGASPIQVTGTLAPGAPPLQLTVPLHDPALVGAQLLRRALLRHGVAVTGQVRSIHARPAPLDPAALAELAHLASPPLAQLVRQTLKDSLNLNAQLLLLQAGLQGPPGLPAEQRGLAALDAFLRRAGLEPREVLAEEGSGLSRKNLVTPRAVVALLRHMAQDAPFTDALPVAGVDGTLRQRLLGTAAQGVLRAKTGTMRYNHALSGYVTTAAGEPLAFAILLNNYRYDPTTGATTPQGEVDALAAMLAQ